MHIPRSLLSFFALGVTLASAFDFETRATSCTLAAAGAGEDDAPAFIAAVTSCATTTIPVGTTLNISSKIDMTGLANKHISLQGTIRMNPNVKYWAGNAFYFAFQKSASFWLFGGTNVLMDGGGTLDGAGQAWYDAFKSNSSLVRPILFTVSGATGATIKNINFINSPMWFNLINESKNVTFDGITINAKSTNSNPAKNTDGWDIYRSDSVVLKNAIVNNGDDCVSFKPNVTNVLVSNITCTGSHGISVGSLGQYSGVYDIVENITATNIQMTTGENGARIKAWAGANVGSGIVKNITFSNFNETDVDHPIVIDQCYETSASDCAANPSNTYIQDVRFTNISGTGSGSKVATLDCSPGARCTDVVVNGITLTAPSGKAGKYECENVQLTGTSASLFGTCTTTT